MPNEETQSASSEITPFGQRLQKVLTDLSQTQAWLAEHSGLDRSLLSRFIKGERNPTIDALQAIAPVLGYKIEELVRGTDAEPRLKELSHFVPQETYQAVVKQMLDFESQLRECAQKRSHTSEQIEQERTRAKNAEKELAKLQHDKERVQEDLKELKRRNADLEIDLRRAREERRVYEKGLEQAVADVALLRAQLATLGKEVSANGKSAQIAAILAAVAAFTGVITMNSYITREKENEDSRAKKSKKTDPSDG